MQQMQQTVRARLQHVAEAQQAVNVVGRGREHAPVAALRLAEVAGALLAAREVVAQVRQHLVHALLARTCRLCSCSLIFTLTCGGSGIIAGAL
jgi:hypothetical protein